MRPTGRGSTSAVGRAGIAKRSGGRRAASGPAAAVVLDFVATSTPDLKQPAPIHRLQVLSIHRHDAIASRHVAHRGHRAGARRGVSVAAALRHLHCMRVWCCCRWRAGLAGWRHLAGIASRRRHVLPLTRGRARRRPAGAVRAHPDRPLDPTVNSPTAKHVRFDGHEAVRSQDDVRAGIGIALIAMLLPLNEHLPFAQQQSCRPPRPSECLTRSRRKQGGRRVRHRTLRDPVRC